ncbi:hypothetical protein NEHOM01_2123 [Nematocida homosporus]|uniref:uncharacterized protein n=1 Tax=Nematocida homosporus TaxID=1912981 RepID=UPI00221FBF4A|nr:uncharacterized protein NEHOM01_2123 [Nematocida homosporus]KAI5187369.1 hypothetical protein NEHOM01_2123 [Nematocida homosporus]
MLRGWFRLGLIFVLLSWSGLNASLVPKDKECRNMAFRLTPINPIMNPEDRKYFKRAIPRIIHEIRLGEDIDENRDLSGNWGAYCAEMGFEHHVWTEHTPNVDSVFAENNAALFHQLCEEKCYGSAEDVLKYELLRHFGGIFVDESISPPETAGVYVDFGMIVPLRGLQVLVSKEAIDVGNSALYADTRLIGACKNHPVLKSISKQIVGNAHRYRRKTESHVRKYATGERLFSMALTGIVGVLQPAYIEQYGMYTGE